MVASTLVLHRLNGDEIYRVASAVMGADDYHGQVRLTFEVETEAEPFKTLPDTESLRARPDADVTVVLDSLEPADLVGKRFHVPSSWSDELEDHVSRIYYCEHQDLNDN